MNVQEKQLVEFHLQQLELLEKLDSLNKGKEVISIEQESNSVQKWTSRSVKATVSAANRIWSDRIVASIKRLGNLTGATFDEICADILNQVQILSTCF